MRSVFFFVIHPRIELLSGTVKEKFHTFWRAFAFLLLVRFFIVLTMMADERLEWFGIRELFEQHASLNVSVHPWVIFFLLVIAAPVYEEIAFRGMFTTNHKLFVFSSSTAIVFLYYLLLSEVMPNALATIPFSIHLFTFLLLVFVFYRILLSSYQVLFRFFNRHYSAFVYSSMVLFAALHLLNYRIGEIDSAKIIAIGFVVLQYFALSVALTFVRIKNGLLWSIGFHMVNNFFPAVTVVAHMFRTGN